MLPLAVYAASLGYPFLSFDDPVYVYESPIVRSAGASGLRSAWTSPYFHDYIPLTQTTLWLDARWAGEPPAPLPFRLQSLAWHIAAGFLVLAAARRWTHHQGTAGLIAVLFSIHPLAVESVAWVSARKNVVSLVLFLAAYLVWSGGSSLLSKTDPAAAGAGGATRPSPRLLRSAAAAILFVGSLLAKSASVGLPLVIFAHAWLIDRRRTGRAALAAAPFALIGALYGLLAIGLRHDLPEQPLAGPAGIVAIDLQVLGLYLLNTAIPWNLSIFYYLDLGAWAAPATWLSLGGIVAGIGLPFAWLRERRRAAFMLLWVLAGLLPALNIMPQPHPVADRFFYWSLPAMVGFLVVAARDGLDALARKRSPAPAAPTWLPVRIGTTLAVVAVILFAAGAWRRTGAWRSAHLLFEDAVRKQPRSSVARMHLGDSLSARPAPAARRRAAAEFRAMLGCPDAGRRLKAAARDGGTFFIALYDYERGRREEADALMAATFAGREHRPDVMLLLARYDLATGRPERTISRLEPSLLTLPGLVEIGRGLISSGQRPWQQELGQLLGAQDLYIAAQQRQGLVAALGLLGRAYLQAERPADAVASFSLASALVPGAPPPELCEAYEKAGEAGRAADCRAALPPSPPPRPGG